MTPHCRLMNILFVACAVIMGTLASVQAQQPAIPELNDRV
ncbi:MAG: hypothetical protein RLY20_1521, partial [Verrucomicrobiota bacterium]